MKQSNISENKIFLKKFISIATVILKDVYITYVKKEVFFSFFWPKEVRLACVNKTLFQVWHLLTAFLAFLFVFHIFLQLFTLLSGDPLLFPCPGWNIWFYDCISKMLLLSTEFETDNLSYFIFFFLCCNEKFSDFRKCRACASIKIWQKSVHLN